MLYGVIERRICRLASATEFSKVTPWGKEEAK
jgi:hypothetical protein